MNRIVLIFSLVLFSTCLFAQPKSDQAFQSLQLGRSAREAALSGKAIAVADGDAQVGLFNPALLLLSADRNAVVLNYAGYFADIGMGYAGYQYRIKNLPLSFMSGVQFFSYGQFDRRDDLGNKLGTVSANDYRFKTGAAYSFRPQWYAGAYLNYFQSNLDSYKASAMASDLSLAYVDTASDFSATLMVENLGVVMQQYSNEDLKLPLNVQIGIAKKLKNAPFRFHITMDNLQRWDLSAEEERVAETDPLTGDLVMPEEKGFGDKLMRHVYAGLELVVTRNLHLRLGYNYRRRQELKTEEKPGTVGFSWGGEFRINRFRFSYARSTYHLAGATNHFSISTSLQKFGW